MSGQDRHICFAVQEKIGVLFRNDAWEIYPKVPSEAEQSCCPYNGTLPAPLHLFPWSIPTWCYKHCMTPIGRFTEEGTRHWWPIWPLSGHSRASEYRCSPNTWNTSWSIYIPVGTASPIPMSLLEGPQLTSEHPCVPEDTGHDLLAAFPTAGMGVSGVDSGIPRPHPWGAVTSCISGELLFFPRCLSRMENPSAVTCPRPPPALREQKGC